MSSSAVGALTSAMPAADPDGSADVALSIRDVGKCYEMYRRPIDRLKQTLWRGRRRFYHEFWALRNVSFDVRRGEAIGIIGRNGSGKSTLLQIIAGTLRPTEGQVEVHGRVAALLELGSGFNPEFTGRENVFLNGAILGLSQQEIEERFDDIASFADIGEFIEHPVKTYSTGMLVRLAFAVQALLEPEILLVDEALAVGDAAFQIKCMTRMSNLLARGTSIILVTHDVDTVRTFCDAAVWLDQGGVRQVGEPREVTARYLEFLLGRRAPRPAAEASQGRARPPADTSNVGATSPASRMASRELTRLDGRRDLVRWGSGGVVVRGFAMDNGTPGASSAFAMGDRLRIEIEIGADYDVDVPGLGVCFAFRNTKGLDIITFTTWEAGLRLEAPRAGTAMRLCFEVENILAPGEYALVLVVEDVRGLERRYLDFVENAMMFRVTANHPVFSAVLPAVRFEICEPATPIRGGQ